ncbi:MAG: NHL repeat-containing protein [Nitrososphaerales archaeon]
MHSLFAPQFHLRIVSITIAILLSISGLLALAPSSFGFSATQAPALTLNHTNYGLTFDSSGNLWISDGTGNQILEYTGTLSDSSTPSLTMNAGSSIPGASGIVFNSAGDLFVASYSGSRVYEFTPPFSTSEPAARSFALNAANGMAFDSSGDLWIASSSVNQVVEILNPGTAPAVGTIITSGLSFPTDVAFDSHGNLWVSNLNNNEILEFAPPYTGNPISTLQVNAPNALTFDSSGNLWVASYFGSSIVENPTSSGGATLTMTNGFSSPTGIAFDSNGNLWVTDRGNSHILEYAHPLPPLPPTAQVDGNITVYSSDTAKYILVTANASISAMHSSPFGEMVFPQYGYLPNGTWGYLGYYKGTFGAVSGGQTGLNVTITVTYNGVSQSGSVDSPVQGKTASVSFVFGNPV